MKNSKEIIKKLFMPVLLILPFIFGTIGYSKLGNSTLDSMYAALSLYFMNLAADGKNIFVEIARWTGPIVLASGVAILVQNIFKRLKNSLICFCKDSTAIYSDNEKGLILSENIRHGFLAGEAVCKRAKEHILIFEKDMDNLNFYEQNQIFFTKHKVYMKLEKMDSFLMDKSIINFFNLSEIIARQYWKENHLAGYFQSGTKEIKIAIIGFDQLGQNLLKFGLMNNIYHREQKIEYHIWGNTYLYEKMHMKMKLMNEDRIIYHKEQLAEDLELLLGANRIIMTQEGDLKCLEMLLHLCKNQEIYLYNPGSDFAENIYAYDNLHTFGCINDILTDEMIKTDRLYKLAKELNYRYDCLYNNGGNEVSRKQEYMDDIWEKLDGFTKGSNISSADYHEIRILLMAQHPEYSLEDMKEELSRNEHIRWCRFHYLNYWSHGIPENGKNKDMNNKIHKCLVPYEQLPKDEQEKDYEAVKLLLEIMPV